MLIVLTNDCVESELSESADIKAKIAEIAADKVNERKALTVN